MVNGLHLYSTFIDLLALHIASHRPIHTLIHSPTAVSAKQGAI